MEGLQLSDANKEHLDAAAIDLTAEELSCPLSRLSKLLHLELRARVMERFNRPQYIV